ncbi:MAG: hypothetical protein LBP33_08935 [Candidatus Adiutrix sp.]|jgi:hypothetical protein|nr:hypothetical protein [Candidatus Adiutrix sp.]
MPENADDQPTAAPAVARLDPLTRDRVLLYVRGLDISPELSLELALEATRHAAARPGGAASAAAAMDSLREILGERGLDPGRKNAGGPYLSSTPGLKRCSMVAGELDLSPLRRLLKGLFRRPGAARAAAGRSR